MPDGGFRWEAESLRFRGPDGRFVDAARVRAAVDAAASVASDELEAIARRYSAGSIDLATWEKESRAVLRRSHVAVAAIAAGGKDRMSPAAVGRVGGRLRSEYEYLFLLAREVDRGDVSPAQLAARARMFGAGTTRSYEAARRAEMTTAGYREEKRTTHSGDSCPECLEYESRGWQPIGTMPGTGESCSCRSRCLCTFEYRGRDQSASAATTAATVAAEDDGFELSGFTPRADEPPPPPPPVVPPPRPAPIAPPAKQPTPAPKPEPAPEPPPTAPAARGVPYRPDLPIGERIAMVPAREAAKRLGEVNTDLDAVRSEIARVRSDERAKIDAMRAAGADERKVARAEAKLRAALADLENREVAAERKARREADAILREILHQGTGPTVGFEHNYSPYLSNSQRDAAEAAARFVAPAVAGTSGGVVGWVPTDATTGHRAFANAATRAVYLDPGSDAGVAVHEFGHQLEFQVPGVASAAREFLAHRVGDEAPRRLDQIHPQGGYTYLETGREDDFGRAFGDARWYVGKHYDSGDTEIVAMGLEKLYTDPAGFAKADPEYSSFILGILDGTLRKP